MKLFSFPIGLFLLALIIGCAKQEEEIIPEPIIKADQREYTESEKRYLAIGDSITSLSGQKLQSELMKAINEGGFEHAIQFCNTNALSFTGKVVEGTNMTIRRASDDYRNPLNRPDDLEKGVIFDYTYDVHVGEEPQPLLLKTDGKIHYFKPIIVQSLCLNCHGTPGEELNKDLYAKIKELYPEDTAIRYKSGHFRGIWHLVFGDDTN